MKNYIKKQLRKTLKENWVPDFDPRNISDVEFDNVHQWDAPDYADAMIIRCTVDGREATDQELDMINDDSQMVHDLLQQQLY